MIPDKVFKKLMHTCKGYTMHKDGQELCDGYKPDYVLKKDDDHIILESESGTNRKAFIGGLIKAAHYLQDGRTGILIFVMVPHKNTTAQSVAKQLRTYFNWIKDRTELREVYVIEAGHYYSDDKVVNLMGKDFKRLSHLI